MAVNSSQNNVRFATFNASLNRNSADELITDLSTPDNEQAKAVAEIIQRTNPDVLLLNEFDYDENGDAIANFKKNYLEVSQNAIAPIDYPYVYFAPSNTGIPTGFDLNNDGTVGDGNDAFGFGNFPGQFGMVLLSKYPIVSNEIRTFQNFLWKDMPNGFLSDDPSIDNPNTEVNENLNGYYSTKEIEVLRLSSKSHWDVPINVNGEIIHVLASNPTPPVFDGEEDRNGKRNHDEIRFWSDYVTTGKSDYIYDDNGNSGGLKSSEKFVIMGDQNADPNDGDSRDNAILQLLDHPLINTTVTPYSEGGVEAAERQAGVNVTHTGNPAFDTADFNDNGSGNLRVDYVLPSENPDTNGTGVFWPESDDPQFDLVGDFPFPSSDHRLVYADVERNNDMQINNQNRKTVTGVKLLGEVTFPTGLQVDGTEVGGISGLAYDAQKGVYYGLSDDRSQTNPARFYNLSIDLSDGSLNDGDITFDGVTTLFDPDGNPFSESSLDPEGIALTKNGTLFISSEGDANQLIDPFVNEFSLQGQQLSELPVPEKFLPTADRSSGIRNNAAFESLTIAPDRRFLYTAAEDALFQDGPRADLEQEGLVRIVKYDLETREPVGEFVYELDKVAEAPEPADGFKVNGLVELLALDNNGTLLALERSFSVGKGNTVKLYEVKTQGALDVSSQNDLFNDPENIPFEIDPAVGKHLLVDFSNLGITPDNLEGLALGPTLPDGSQSLIVASDNNFSDTQVTQFIALSLDMNSTPAVLPTVETPNTINNDEIPKGVLKGDSDDTAIWVNPNNPEESIVIGTLKDGGLATFNLKGEIQQTIPAEIIPSDNFGLPQPSDSYKARFNNVDIIYNFPFASMIIDDEPKIDLAIASDRANDSLAIFTISENGELNKLSTPELDDPAFSIFGVDDGEATAYGLATYTNPASGKSYIFVTQADGNKVAQIELTSKLGPADEALMEAKIVRTLELPIPEGGEVKDGQAEGLVVDQESGFLYVAMEEGAGILKFSAEPESSNDFTVVQGSQSKGDLEQVPFSDFITFGDSTVDVGNVSLATEGTTPPSPPYFNGRFSNGPLINEILAQEIGLSASTPSLAGGNNYAFGGSELGADDDGVEPSVGEQINSYLAEDTPTTTDLFFISAGSNNIVSDLDGTPAEILANIPQTDEVLADLTEHITTLAGAGAKNFIISNLTFFGSTPLLTALGVSDEVNTAVNEFNNLLDNELDDLENELGINITELDVAGEIAKIQTNPSEFGFTNVTEPALNTTTGAVVPNPDEYFWWDDLHGTGAFYNLIAQGLVDDFPKGTTEFTDTNPSPLVPDVEGLSIYYGADGAGYLIASSQGDSSYAVFNREGDNEYLGNFVIGENGDIDQVNETDGLDIVNVPLGSEFPNGLLVVQDGANDPQNVVQDGEELENNSTNFKFVPWEGVANAFDNPLQIDPTSYDPRNPQPQSPSSEVETLVSGTNGDDLFVVGDSLKGENNILFAGAGDDEIDLTGGSKNRVNAGSGDDLIFVSLKDRVFGGAGNDEFDATDGMGKNRMSGGKGDDIFFLGKKDRAFGGVGNDKFFVQSGGDNIISGGEGADQFWIADTEIPQSANTIVDFEAGTDVIGILGSTSLGINADSLVLSEINGNTEIGFSDRTLAILNGVTDLDVNTSVVFG